MRAIGEPLIRELNWALCMVHSIPLVEYSRQRRFAWLPVRTLDAGIVWCRHYWRREMRPIHDEDHEHRTVNNFAYLASSSVPLVEDSRSVVVDLSSRRSGLRKP